MTFKVIRGQGQAEEMTSVPYRDYFSSSTRSPRFSRPKSKQAVKWLYVCVCVCHRLIYFPVYVLTTAAWRICGIGLVFVNAVSALYSTTYQPVTCLVPFCLSVAAFLVLTGFCQIRL